MLHLSGAALGLGCNACVACCMPSVITDSPMTFACCCRFTMAIQGIMLSIAFTMAAFLVRSLYPDQEESQLGWLIGLLVSTTCHHCVSCVCAQPHGEANQVGSPEQSDLVTFKASECMHESEGCYFLGVNSLLSLAISSGWYAWRLLQPFVAFSESEMFIGQSCKLPAGLCGRLLRTLHALSGKNLEDHIVKRCTAWCRACSAELLVAYLSRAGLANWRHAPACCRLIHADACIFAC